MRCKYHLRIIFEKINNHILDSILILLYYIKYLKTNPTKHLDIE